MAFDIRLREVNAAIQQAKGRKEALRDRLRESRKALRLTLTEVEDTLKAQTLLQSVAVSTQAELEFHVSSVATLALNAVFPDPYSLKVDFIPKRGKSEAMLTLEREGKSFDPMSANGGGVVDLTAFALRVSMLSLSRNTRKVIILDEPFRFLSKDLHPRAGQVIRDLADKLGVQFILVTHEKALADMADRVFDVSLHNKRSVIVTR